MLNMRIVRSPLTTRENEAILTEYNRLTGARIPFGEFVHWVTNSPEGPAWHAILETDDSQIVGHTSVFPLRASNSGMIPAKSEYSFLHEDFRKEKIRGYETVSRPAFIILLDKLFDHCQGQGWSPIFASTNEKNQVFTRKVGLRPVEFPLSECLLILRPARSARETPNLSRFQRASMFSAGVVHGSLWPVAARLFAAKNGISLVSPDSNDLPGNSLRPLSFFDDRESLTWRYLDGQYQRFDLQHFPGHYLIAKNGSAERFLRVVHWQLESLKALPRLFAALVRQAQQQRALGVRWAVYDGTAGAATLVGGLRRLGMLCATRTRIVMIRKNDEKWLNPALWNMNDSLFSFDP